AHKSFSAINQKSPQRFVVSRARSGEPPDKLLGSHPVGPAGEADEFDRQRVMVLETVELFESAHAARRQRDVCQPTAIGVVDLNPIVEGQLIERLVRRAEDGRARAEGGGGFVEPPLSKGALSRCDAASAKRQRHRNCQASATAFRHVVIAAARSARWVWAEMRWLCRLKVL